jgi:hypothetical protein
MKVSQNQPGFASEAIIMAVLPKDWHRERWEIDLRIMAHQMLGRVTALVCAVVHRGSRT